MKTILMVSILIIISSFPLRAQDVFELIEKNDFETIKRMVTADAEILNKRNQWNESLINVAARSDKLELVQYLLEKGADVNSVDPLGRYPIYHSANNDNIEMAQILLATGADIDSRIYRREAPIFRAVIRGFVEYVEFCIDYGCDINSRDAVGNTILSKAVMYAKTEVLKCLIGKKVDVNAINDYGQNGLHLAAIRGFTNTLQILIEAGTDVNLKDNEGNTPLFYAGKYGQKNAYDLLVQKSDGKQKVKTNFDFSTSLKEELEEGEAFVWYLTHSGWAVKTKNNLLVFDYTLNPYYVEHIPEYPLLSNGHINPEELKDLQVTFFVSHYHGDHYYKKILEFEKDYKNINYVFGWQAFDDSKYTYLTKDKEKRNVNGIEIESLLTTDPGAGFIVNVDGVSMFFFGDFNVAEGIEKAAKYISDEYKSIDLSFVLGLGGPMHVSDYYIENVISNVIFPIHGGNFEFLLKEYTNKMKAKTKAVFCSPENRGDVFFFSKGKIK